MQGIDGVGLFQSLQETMRQAYKANESMIGLGKAKAQAEANYRAALAAKELELKTGGYPATLVKDLARGNKEVSELFILKECAITAYETTQEEIMLRKREADILREQINREYNRRD